VSVRETRVTSIVSHMFIGMSVLFIDELKLIPRPVLDGLFLYLAITALHTNQLFERITLLVTEQVSSQTDNRRSHLGCSMKENSFVLVFTGK